MKKTRPEEQGIYDPRGGNNSRRSKGAKPRSDGDKHSKNAHQEEVAKERLSLISPPKAEQTIDNFETKSQEEAKRRIF